MSPASVAAAIGAALVLVLHTTALGQERESGLLSVRSSHERMRDAIDAGCAASATFRALVDRLGASDGVVYVEPGPCRGRKACLLHWMAATATHRVLRVHVHPTLLGDELIALIGHELQHAWEVVSQPRIRTGRGMYWFFRPAFSAESGASETGAALDAEHRVRSELKQRREDLRERKATCVPVLPDRF